MRSIMREVSRTVDDRVSQGDIEEIAETVGIDPAFARQWAESAGEWLRQQADVLGDEEDEESADADVLGEEESTDADVLALIVYGALAGRHMYPPPPPWVGLALFVFNDLAGDHPPLSL